MTLIRAGVTFQKEKGSIALSKKRNKNNRLGRNRDLLSNPIAKQSLVRPVQPSFSFDRPPLQEFEDRRVLPRKIAPKTFSTRPYRLKVPKNAPLHHVGFDVPKQVLLCVRRKRRKEVLFATGGAGKPNKRKPRRNKYSNVRC